jgi:hypothetical protein
MRQFPPEIGDRIPVRVGAGVVWRRVRTLASPVVELYRVFGGTDETSMLVKRPASL